jgi:cation diffusion facilitator CzcD-associated flavoprotein CzcO
MRHEIAVIGAGPYGLAAAAHLRNAGLEVKVFGEAMAFWDRQMPAGMLLRSPRSASHIADPLRQLTLDDYERSEQVTLNAPIELRRFVEYGRWFQRRVAPDLDTRPVERVEPAGDGFRVTVDGGDQVEAGRIIVAAGIASFAWSPPPFGSLPRELVSHSSAERDLHRFAGRRVLVVGGGQSALETAALLHEAGAKTEVVVRRPAVTWLDQRAGWLKHEANPLRPLL